MKKNDVGSFLRWDELRKSSELAEQDYKKALELNLKLKYEIESSIIEYIMSCEGLSFEFEQVSDKFFSIFGGYKKFIDKSIEIAKEINEELESNEEFINTFSNMIFGDYIERVELKDIEYNCDRVVWKYWLVDKSNNGTDLSISFNKFKVEYNFNEFFHSIIIHLNGNYYNGGYDIFSLYNKITYLIYYIDTNDMMPSDEVIFEHEETHLLDFRAAAKIHGRSYIDQSGFYEYN